jgi:uncharacterized membrane protein
MRKSNKRALTWALIALGIAMVVLGGVLIATFPWSEAGGPFGHFWGQGQFQGQGVPPATQPGTQPGAQPGYAPWYGYHHGWGFHGPRFFGGGLFILVLVVTVVSLAARRGRYHRWHAPEERLDAEEILRRAFAEGRITEEEYKSRSAALRK